MPKTSLLQVLLLPILLVVLAGTVPQAGIPSPKGSSTEDPPSAEALFDDGRVIRIRIEIARPDLEKLRADPGSYVLANLRDGSRLIRNIGVCLKGSAGSFRDIDDKPGFTLKANHFVPKQRVRGLRKLYLNNAVQDPSYLCDRLGNELFRAAGVPAPRTGHARVELNGRDLGLYVLIEGVTRDFLERSFESPHGALYEGPGDISGDLDLDARGIFTEEIGLEMLRAAARDPDPSSRMRRLGDCLDLDRFISFVAMEVMLAHWDGYALAVNNFRLYHEPSGRMVFIPQGTDQLFQQPDASIFADMQGLLATAVLETPEGRRLYRERVGFLLAQVFEADAIRRRALALAEPLGRALEEEGSEKRREHEAAVEDLLQRISLRAEKIIEELIGLR